jgi:hypothetical protein
VITGAYDGKVIIWDSKTGIKLRTLYHDRMGFAFARVFSIKISNNN